MMRRRIAAAAALVLVVAGGLAVHRALAGADVADVAGDALYAVAAYAGLVLLLPRTRRVVLAGAALAWCVAVEFLQLSGLPAQWAASAPAVRWVLGTGFDARDLAVYAAAVIAVLGTDAVVSRLPGAGPARTMEG